MREMKAKESKFLEEVVRDFPGDFETARKRLARLKKFFDIPDGARLLDIGASQGELLAAYHQLGYRAVGVEPWDKARETAALLSERLQVPIDIRDGRAESLPFEDESFDVVLATSVLEHVDDLDAAVSEAYRVLKPGGLFWFNSASSVCPRTGEISGFPLFGWYPDRFKIRIMNWAKDNRPELVGYTEHPAVHWFTPRKARRILKGHGFREVYDRWDVSRAYETGRIRSMAMRFFTLCRFTRLLADMSRPGCNYSAVK